jgi:hypothetical protein
MQLNAALQSLLLLLLLVTLLELPGTGRKMASPFLLLSILLPVTCIFSKTYMTREPVTGA